MDRFWTWGGKYVGVRQKEYLVACDGTVLGKFFGRDIYDQDGYYVGRTGAGRRLIKNRTKSSTRRPAFSRGREGNDPGPPAGLRALSANLWV
mgnify:CR=1 FL=1